MRKFLSVSLLGTFLVCSLFIGCDSNSGKQFASKQDSLSFAQAVMEKYPGEKAGESFQQDTSGPAKGKTFQSAGMEPIDWETVLLYQSNYDKDPQLKSPKGYYYQGFYVDSAGYQTLIKTPSIKGLYLRLGKKNDGSYTIMILGTDEKGNVMNNTASRDSGAQTNFDNIPSCPEICPMEP